MPLIPQPVIRWNSTGVGEERDMRNLVYVMVVCLGACEEEKAAPPPPPPVAVQPAKPPPRLVTVTSSSPEAAKAWHQGRDFHAQLQLGFLSIDEHKWTEAVGAMTRATAIDPRAGSAWNGLGYANLLQGRTDDAIAALKKFVEVAPNEPNAHDSLGEALLRA